MPAAAVGRLRVLPALHHREGVVEMAHHRGRSREDLAEWLRQLEGENRELRRRIEAMEAAPSRDYNDDDLEADDDLEGEDGRIDLGLGEGLDDVGDGMRGRQRSDHFTASERHPAYARYRKAIATGDVFGADIARFAAEEGISAETPEATAMKVVSRYRRYMGRS
jgi:hypothetical protein